MAAEDVEVAERFRAALEAAVQTGEREPVYALLAPDVEWITPQRTLHGIDDMRANWAWGSTPESFEYAFDDSDWVDHGDGYLVCEARQVYRVRGSGDFAYDRQRRVQLTIANGAITRYEMSIVG